MAALISLFIVVVLSLTVVRIGTLALEMTGLSREVASFQALSAFSGTGFTTAEAGYVVDHPVRRRIISLLIELGGAGVITTISSLILTFTTSRGGSAQRLAILLAGLFVLFLLSRSRWVNRHLNRLIEWGLARWTDLDLRDYAGLLRLEHGYAVAELDVQLEDWLSSASLRDLALPSEGVVVLAVRKADGAYIGAPSSDYRLEPGDQLIAYGREELLKELSVRHYSDTEAHERAVVTHQRELEEEARRVREPAG